MCQGSATNHRTDAAESLNPCPLCGEGKGYTLHEGSTYRWWNVHCAACGEFVTECRSDNSTTTGSPKPARWDPADASWREATRYSTRLLKEIEVLRADCGLLRDQRDALSNELSGLQCEAAALRNGLAAALDFAGTVAGGASWWDDVWAEHQTKIDAAMKETPT